MVAMGVPAQPASGIPTPPCHLQGLFKVGPAACRRLFWGTSRSTAPGRSDLRICPWPASARKIEQRRHGLAVVLTCAVGSFLAGSKSWTAVAAWVRDADRDALRQLGISTDTVPPSESTIRRTLAQMDADDLDRRVGAWAATRTALVAGRRVIAVDGKSLRGAGHGGRMPHLLAALDHHRGVVVAQQAVPSQGDKGSEIPALRQLLGRSGPARCGGYRGRGALPPRDCHVDHRPWRGLPID